MIKIPQTPPCVLVFEARGNRYIQLILIRQTNGKASLDFFKNQLNFNLNFTQTYLEQCHFSSFPPT